MGTRQDAPGNKKITLPVNERYFVLPQPAYTSAGVYDHNNNLIRTLWSYQYMPAGANALYWDGRDDAGNAVTLNGHTVKILSSNVTYQWEGALIGNSGNPMTGANMIHANKAARDVCFIGDEVYWALEYHETWPAQWVTSLAHPENGKTWFEPLRQTNQNTAHCVTDGNYVYWGGFDPYSSPVFSFVWATVAATKQRAVFANGVSATMAWGSTYASTIAGKTLDNSYISGMAVQKTNNCLLVARKVQNEVQVLHKTTGALLQTVTIANAGRMAVDSNDNVWIISNTTLQYYTVGSDGALTLTRSIDTGVTLSGVDVSPDNTTIAVCDMDTQVLKGFSTTTGALLWTLGTAGGYLTDATVTNTKFYWKDAAGARLAFVKYTPDGGFYVGDGANWRYLQFDSSRNYVRSISWIPSIYNVCVDPNNPRRLFCGFLEFDIDYTKPAAQGWTLKKNWGAPFTTSLYDSGGIRANMVTFPQNGRTYGLLRGTGAAAVNYYVVEMVEGATMRIPAAATITPLTSYLQPDGSLVKATVTASTTTLTQYPLTGFDAGNNPVWSATGTVLTTSANPNFNFNSVAILPDKVVGFDISARAIYDSSDYHVIAFPKGGNAPLWKTARGTNRDYAGPYPDEGWFDNGNNVNTGLNGGGGFMTYMNNHLIWNYHGEFWKQSQANMYQHIDAATGLMIGSFGALRPDNVTNQESPYGVDGNALTGSIVYANGNYYLYHNGESYGTHRWKLQGMDTVTVQTLPLTSIPSPVQPATDLLAGLPRYGSLPDGQGGWNRSPAQDFKTVAANTEYCYIRGGYYSFNPFESPDISIYYAEVNGSAFVSRTLGNNTGAQQWTLQGEVYFSTTYVNTSTTTFGTGGWYMEVLDSAGKIICRVYRTSTVTSNNVMLFNDKTIYTDGSDAAMTVLNYHYQPFHIYADQQGMLHFGYSNLPEQGTINMVDSGAAWNDPATFRIYCFANSLTRNYERLVAIRRLYFQKS